MTNKMRTPTETETLPRMTKKTMRATTRTTTALAGEHPPNLRATQHGRTVLNHVMIVM